MLAKDTLEGFKLECELRRLTPWMIKGYYNSTLLFLPRLERQQEINEPEAIRPLPFSAVFGNASFLPCKKDIRQQRASYPEDDYHL